MNETVIRVEGLSKQYRIGGKQARVNTLRDMLTNAFVSQFRRVGNLVRGQTTSASNPDAAIWALKDVSFEVKRGEVLGIIGRNGAGKSTLLKILSCITEPTEGCARIRGRVGSLIDVGTGFHSELTGMENIYLNGAIIGMKKAEIDRKYDEIVAFADLDKFIDTPVKHYSSGMYMRLAFAVAAHLEPEILIVDEVLAVGDATFQKKCLKKMGNVAKEGRTVLFVSHNMVAVQNLCDRAILLNDGQVVEDGQPDKVVSQYLQTSFSALTEQVWAEMTAAPGNDNVRLRRARVRPVNGASSDPITVHTPFVLEFEYWSLQFDASLDLSLKLQNEQGIVVFDAGRINKPVWQDNNVTLGPFRDVCHVPGDLLNDGMYRVELCVSKDLKTVYRHPDVLAFDVQDSIERRHYWYGEWLGVIRPKLEWYTEIVKETSS